MSMKNLDSFTKFFNCFSLIEFIIEKFDMAGTANDFLYSKIFKKNSKKMLFFQKPLDIPPPVV